MTLAAPLDLERAKEIVRGLDLPSRTVVELLSVFYLPTPRTDVARALGLTGFRMRGKVPTGADVLPWLESLIGRGIVVGTPAFAVAPGLAHAATLSAFQRGAFTAMTNAVRAARPDPRPGSALRELRLALYAGAWHAARPLAQAQTAADLLPLFSPFDRAWIATLPADLRTLALRTVLDAAARALSPAPDALAMLEAEPELDDASLGVLVEQLVLRGRLDDAERVIGARTSVEALLGRADLYLCRGRGAEALVAYEAALRAHRKRAGKRTAVLPGRSGVLFIVALLHEGRPASIARARDLATAGAQPFSGPAAAAYGVLAQLAGVRAGQIAADAAAAIGSGVYTANLDTFTLLLRALTAVWVGRPAQPSLLVALEQRIARAEAAGYAWLAAQAADVLLRAEPARASGDAGAHLRALRDALPGVRLADLHTRKEAWEGALDELLAIGSARRTSVAALPLAAEPEKRLAWIVAERGALLTVEPREQVRQKDGFSRGRPIALKRLYEDAASMTWLRAEDRAAAGAAIERSIVPQYFGHYQEVVHNLDPARALHALVGHPAVFVEPPSRPGNLVPAEIRRGRVRLRAERAPGGLHLALDPAPKTDGESVVVRRVGDATIEVVELTPAHHAIARALGRKGLTVPDAAEPRIRGVLGALSGLVAVDADVGGDAAALAVPGDPRPYVILRPLGAGLSAEITVRPLGPGGPHARPGQSGTTMLAEVDGRRRAASRDLAAEARAEGELLAACPALAAGERSSAGISLADRDQALAALVELHALGDRVAIEWPDGEPLRVTEEVALGDARFSVRTDGDELAVDGALVLPDGRRIELAELLDYLAATPGRFLRVTGDERFLALHADLRRRLADLAAFAGPDRRKTRLPALLAPLLDELLAGAAIEADDAYRRRLALFAPGGAGKDPEPPKTFRAELRPYQLDGFRWLARLGRLGAGACLADDMGLGKTVEALALLVLRAPEGPSLVVAPTSVLPVWIDEAARFAPTLRARTFAGEGRAALLDGLGPFDLVVTSYALLQQDAELLARVPWTVAVLDEAQAIKNEETLRARAAHGLRASQKIATTGTPIENRLEDLHGIFRFLAPSLLGSAASFAARFSRPIDRERDAAARERLRAMVGPFILRRTKTDVLPELPARTEVTLRVPLGVESIALYEAIRSEAIASLTGEGPGAAQRRIQILAAITRLRRAASHPRLVLRDAAAGGEKLAALGELLDEILPGGHRVLVFSQFVDHLTLVRAFLDERGVTYQYLDGSTPPAKRKKAVDAFQAGEGDAFLISLRAGGFGLNLTAADYVVHMDPWWNPAVEDQASDRAHRIGQTRPVTIYRLVARDTIEDKILELHHRKRELAASLLEGSEAVAKLGEEELLDLLRGGAAAAEEEAAPAKRQQGTEPSGAAASRSKRRRRAP